MNDADQILRGKRWTVATGDSLELLKLLPSDSIVVDPPSGISFMGRDWDSDKGGRDKWIAWLAEIFREGRRVLKPGGYALVWALPRTSHWTGMAVESGGFEIRDCIQHLFGSGFPKYLDVSKAIEKSRDDRKEILKVTAWIAEARDAADLTNGDIDEDFGYVGMAGHWTTQKAQPTVPTMDQASKLFEVLGTKPPPKIAELFEGLNDRKRSLGEAWHDREVTGIGTGVNTVISKPGIPLQDGAHHEFERTAPSTEEGLEWKGWATGLKPSAEFWWVARKPLPGTVAANVLEHGTGAFNINACSVGEGMVREVPNDVIEGDGRWPPHSVLSHSEECGETCADGCAVANLAAQIGGEVGAFEGFPQFQYVPKPARAEKDAGVTREPMTGGEATGRKEGSAGTKNPRAGAGRTGGARNPHPTAKPIDLMRWLVRLVTPPNGIVLDFFNGSGTTGCAAVLERFRYIGFDMDAINVEVSRERIAYWANVDPNYDEIPKPKPKTEEEARQVDLVDVLAGGPKS